MGAVLDGYQTIVYNFIRDGSTQLNLLDSCDDFKGFDLEKEFNEETQMKRLAKVKGNLGQIAPDFKRVNQISRLTIVCSSAATIHAYINLGAKSGDKTTKVLNTYDLIALRP